MDSMKLQQLFEEVCEFKMTRSDAHFKLVILANAVWHGNFIPSVSTLKKDIVRRRGAYLIDFFSRVDVVSDSQAFQLRKPLDALQKQLPEVQKRETFYPGDRPGYDDVAHLWGLANGLRPSSVPGLLNLQRRAYQRHWNH
jgi:hypothetical protein